MAQATMPCAEKPMIHGLFMRGREQNRGYGWEQAAKTLLQIQVAGKEVSADEQNHLLDTIKARYEKQTTPQYAAARLWVDDIIDPINTRMLVSEAIAAANHNPHTEEMKTGVFRCSLLL